MILRPSASAIVCAAILASGASAAHADTIETATSWAGDSFGYFGEPNTATYGQTFVAPNQSLQSFTFFISDRQAETTTPNTLAGYVMKWNDTFSIPTGGFLFEGLPRLTSSAPTFGYQPFKVTIP
ncbi:MAG: hypothetical protein KDM64_06285, partial [Verrucomicrobiae bacterium]|nr:hypothetical protein [Verrucomicrobiae bacterium]